MCGTGPRQLVAMAMLVFNYDITQVQMRHTPIKKTPRKKMLCWSEYSVALA